MTIIKTGLIEITRKKSKMFQTNDFFPNFWTDCKDKTPLNSDF